MTGFIVAGSAVADVTSSGGATTYAVGRESIQQVANEAGNRVSITQGSVIITEPKATIQAVPQIALANVTNTEGKSSVAVGQESIQEAAEASDNAIVVTQGDVVLDPDTTKATVTNDGTGEVKVGDGQDGYYGGHISGEIGLLKIDGKATIGTDGFNGYVKGDVEVLTADGKASFEFDRKSGEFAVGVDASATAASASGSAGVSFLEVGYKEHKQKGATGAKPEKLSLFKVEAGASASAGGAFAMYAESEKAIETRLFNVNATSIKLKGVAGLGFDLNITVPTIYWKWPW